MEEEGMAQFRLKNSPGYKDSGKPKISKYVGERTASMFAAQMTTPEGSRNILSGRKSEIMPPARSTDISFPIESVRNGAMYKED